MLEGNLVADPLFVGGWLPAPYRYRPGPTSPTIDAGTPEGAPDHDFAGVTRPLGPAVDIGPFEVGP